MSQAVTEVYETVTGLHAVSDLLGGDSVYSRRKSSSGSCIVCWVSGKQ